MQFTIRQRNVVAINKQTHVTTLEKYGFLFIIASIVFATLLN